MAIGTGAGLYQGNCTGHGICVPANVHAHLTACLPPCNQAIPKSIAAMNGTNLWAPYQQLPMSPLVPTVLINSIAPILDQDLLTNHPSTCTQQVTYALDKCFGAITCSTSVLCIEDIGGGGAHPRKATATTKSVFINGKRVCRIGDPLGPPCLSKIAGGSKNVFIGA